LPNLMPHTRFEVRGPSFLIDFPLDQDKYSNS
jgi:hypothetical protein